MFGQELSIIVELIDDDGWTDLEYPTDKQSSIFKWFKEDLLNIKALISSSIFDHYNNQLSELRDAWGYEADVNAPVLSNENEIWKLLKLSNVLISGGWFNALFISLEVSWNPEHGITIMFENGKLIQIE